MEESKKFLLYLVIIIIVLIAASAVGIYFYEKNKSSAQTAMLAKCQNALSLFNPKISILDSLKTPILVYMSLVGNVKKISNNVVTLSLNDKSVDVVLVGEGLPVFSYITIGGKRQSVIAKFSDIKVGQKLGIEARLSYANQLVGFTIYILD